MKLRKQEWVVAGELPVPIYASGCQEFDSKLWSCGYGLKISNRIIFEFIAFSGFNPNFRGTNQNSGQFLNKCFSWTPGTNWLEDKEMSQRRPNSPVLITMGKI